MRDSHPSGGAFDSDDSLSAFGSEAESDDALSSAEEVVE